MHPDLPKVLRLMTHIVNSAAEGFQYTWSDEFHAKNTDDAISRATKYLVGPSEDPTLAEDRRFDNIRWNEFSVDDLRLIGWGFWSEESKLMLCPLWLKEVFFPGKEHDNDHRFGCLAYGFKLNAEGHLNIRKEGNRWVGEIATVA